MTSIVMKRPLPKVFMRVAKLRVRIALSLGIVAFFNLENRDCALSDIGKP
ncbi:MAG: hypothetical protein WA090_03060 [Candidatus Nanopelagicaceae bacterium]